MTFEEIRSLQNDLAMAKEIIKNQKKQIFKGRKIVAMLFWEWKKRKRLYLANGHRSSNAGWGLYEQANLMKVVFEKAYKMLKETK